MSTSALPATVLKIKRTISTNKHAHILSTHACICALFTFSPHADAAAKEGLTHWNFTRPAHFYRLDKSKDRKICGSVLRALNAPADARNIDDRLSLIRHSLVVLSTPLEIKWIKREAASYWRVIEESNFNIQGHNLLVRRDTSYLGGLPSQSISFLGEDSNYEDLEPMIERGLSCFGSCSQTIMHVDNRLLIAAVRNYDRKARVKVASLPDLKILCSLSAKRPFDKIQY